MFNGPYGFSNVLVHCCCKINHNIFASSKYLRVIEKNPFIRYGNGFSSTLIKNS
jgi:hypothetical protein